MFIVLLILEVRTTQNKVKLFGTKRKGQEIVGKGGTLGARKDKTQMPKNST